MQALLEEARRHLGAAVTLRRSLHAEPEIGLDLPRTQAKVLAALEGLPLQVRTGHRTSSVVATLHGARPGRAILLRADMDALPLQEETGLEFASSVPGSMHACGHDAHVAMLVGAARVLVAHQAELSGAVRFMFQPGEEGYGGARLMLDEGLLEEPSVDAALALHAQPALPPGVLGVRSGPALASSDTFRVTVRGRGGHASRPSAAADPIPVACEIVQALQVFMTRSVDIFAPGVLTVARIEAGTTSNIIPETATLEGTVRALAADTRTRVLDGVRRMARGIVEAHGLSAEVRIDEGYPVTVNDPTFTRLVADVARRLLGAEKVVEQGEPNMAADDFSYVLERVPGALMSLGTRPAGLAVAPAAHSNRYLLDEGAMEEGIALNAAVALAYLAAGAPDR